jgi:hypothetical protein
MTVTADEINTSKNEMPHTWPRRKNTVNNESPFDNGSASCAHFYLNNSLHQVTQFRSTDESTFLSGELRQGFIAIAIKGVGYDAVS